MWGTQILVWAGAESTPLKPKEGLNGPPVLVLNLKRVGFTEAASSNWLKAIRLISPIFFSTRNRKRVFAYARQIRAMNLRDLLVRRC